MKNPIAYPCPGCISEKSAIVWLPAEGLWEVRIPYYSVYKRLLLTSFTAAYDYKWMKIRDICNGHVPSWPEDYDGKWIGYDYSAPEHGVWEHPIYAYIKDGKSVSLEDYMDVKADGLINHAQIQRDVAWKPAETNWRQDERGDWHGVRFIEETNVPTPPQGKAWFYNTAWFLEEMPL